MLAVYNGSADVALFFVSMSLFDAVFSISVFAAWMFDSYQALYALPYIFEIVQVIKGLFVIIYFAFFISIEKRFLYYLYCWYILHFSWQGFLTWFMF